MSAAGHRCQVLRANQPGVQDVAVLLADVGTDVRRRPDHDDCANPVVRKYGDIRADIPHRHPGREKSLYEGGIRSERTHETRIDRAGTGTGGGDFEASKVEERASHQAVALRLSDLHDDVVECTRE